MTAADCTLRRGLALDDMLYHGKAVGLGFGGGLEALDLFLDVEAISFELVAEKAREGRSDLAVHRIGHPARLLRHSLLAYDGHGVRFELGLL